MGKKKQIKPSEYPERMLKTLVKEYDVPENVDIRYNGMELSILAADAGIVSDYKTEERVSNNHVRYTYDDFFPEIMATIGIMEKAGWVEKQGSASDLRILPTVEGLRHARWLLQPYHVKAWLAIRSDLRTVFIAIVITILTALIVKEWFGS